MSHERTVIEPSDGLTVLVGPNNCGKSAFVSALQILCHNAKSNYVLRHGEKKCEILVETDDGHSIRWSRTRSGSPKYVIDDQEFDRLKGGVPAELHKILGLEKVSCEKDEFDVHFGEQKSPVFLLNDSGKASAQFFASSSDAIRLVEMQDRHKTKVRDARRDQARWVEEKHRIADQLERLKPVESISQRLHDCEREFREIAESEARLEQAEIVIRAFAESMIRLAQEEAKAECLRELKAPPRLQDSVKLDQLVTDLTRCDRSLNRASLDQAALRQLSPSPRLADAKSLQDCVDDLTRIETALRLWARRHDALSGLAVPPPTQDESKLQSLIHELARADWQCKVAVDRDEVFSRLESAPEPADYSPLESLLNEMGECRKRIAAAQQESARLEKQLSESTEELQEWVRIHPACPTCGAKTTVDQIMESGGHRHA